MHLSINPGWSVTPAEADEAPAIDADFDTLEFFEFGLQDVSLSGARDSYERLQRQLDNHMFLMLKECYLGLWFKRNMDLGMSLQLGPLMKAPKLTNYLCSV
jgi:hypothetical protein